MATAVCLSFCFVEIAVSLKIAEILVQIHLLNIPNPIKTASPLFQKVN